MMLASVAGCSAPVEISGTNRDSSYQQKLTRVLVTTNLHAPDLSARQNEGFVRADEIRQSLAAAWRPLGVSFEVVDLNAGEGAAAAAAQFAPQQILALTLQGYQLYKFVVDAYASMPALRMSRQRGGSGAAPCSSRASWRAAACAIAAWAARFRTRTTPMISCGP